MVLGNGLNSRYELTWVRRGWISIRHETSERFLRSVKRSWFLKVNNNCTVKTRNFNEDWKLLYWSTILCPIKCLEIHLIWSNASVKSYRKRQLFLLGKLILLDNTMYIECIISHIDHRTTWRYNELQFHHGWHWCHWDGSDSPFLHPGKGKGSKGVIFIQHNFTLRGWWWF